MRIKLSMVRAWANKQIDMGNGGEIVAVKCDTGRCPVAHMLIDNGYQGVEVHSTYFSYFDDMNRKQEHSFGAEIRRFISITDNQGCMGLYPSEVLNFAARAAKEIRQAKQYAKVVEA